MSKLLTVGNDTFEYPEEGTKPGWGESASDWAEAVTDALATLVGPNDIQLTTVSLLDSQSTAVDVGVGSSSLSFSNAAVRSFDCTYTVIRGSNVETGTMDGYYNGSTWAMSHDHTGDAGMDFQITSTGQVQYFSDSSSTGSITFSASTIDQ